MSGANLVSGAVVPTSASSVDVAGPVNSFANQPTSANTVSGLLTPGAEFVAGSAIAPDGSLALVGEAGNMIPVIEDPLSASPSVGTPVDVSQFTGEGGAMFNVFTDAVAITPDGQAGLATADSQGAIALMHSASGWTVDSRVQAPGTNQAGHAHAPGWILAPHTSANATTYDGVTISNRKGSDGDYVGLLMDASDHTVAVVTGLGTAGATVAGLLTDTTNITHGYNGFNDYGNGGMAFSPTTANAAVVVTRNGFGVLSLVNPASPTLGSLTTIPAAMSGNGAQSIAVAPDGNHVAVAVNDTLYFFSGLLTATGSTPLTSSGTPLTMPGPIMSIDYSASGNLVVNYTNAGLTTGSLAVVSGSTTANPSLRGAVAPSGLALSGPPHDVNGMSVVPEVAAINRGYFETASDGGIFNFGNAGYYGSQGGKPLNAPVVGIAATPDGAGYFEVASDGGIFNYGDAGFFQSEGGKPLFRPMVGIAATPDGQGYFEVASDGGVFTFGDAGYYGSQGGKPLNSPVVGIAATPDGKGYFEVASDGGVFNYGDAGYFGSMGGMPLNKPVVGIAATPDGLGYWLVASDGGIFNFGDAPYLGSMGGMPLNKPVVGITATASGGGYIEVASDGGVFTFGDAAYRGSMGGMPLNKPVVGIAAANS
ncbi:MAG TPA: hypothetical protein VK277_16020 [Acidimicrobiales bacterium]|nr:hypothetical protein [Acidimicrobiales bacterium]